MKKILLFFIVATFIFSACEKEATITTSFPFTVTADYKENAVINVPNELSFELTPEHIVTTNVYTLSYRILNGNGVFSLPNGEEIQEKQTIELDGLKLKSLFTPQSLGAIKIEFTFGDQQEENRVFIVDYISQNNPFEVELNSARTNITVNEAANFTLTLTNKGTDPDVTYTIKTFISQGTGNIKLVKANNKEDITLGESYGIDEGTTTYEVVFAEEGVNTITVEVEDINGQKLIEKFDFTVNVIDFGLSAIPERNETNLGKDININFLISEVSGGNDDYTLRYVIESGNANIFNGDTQVFAGTNIKVPLAQEFSWFFKPLEKGPVVIRFIAKNNSGVEKEKTVSLNVNDRDFDFTATRSLASIPVGEPVNISYKITEQGGSSVDSYTMVFNSSSNGKLTINSVDYMAGDVIKVPALEFIGVYTPSIPGNHTVTSTIIAASNNQSNSNNISISVEASEFDFSVTSKNEVIVNESIDLSFNINELIGDSKFKINYNITGTENDLQNNQGVILIPDTDYNVDNTFAWKLTGVNAGTMDIKFTVTNQYGVTKNKSLSIKIIPIDFDFNVSPVGTNFLTDTPIKFNFDMYAPSSLSYKLSFKSNGNAIIKSNNLTYNEGDKIPISSTGFSVFYTSKSNGSNNITWTIEASNDVIKSRDNSIDINQIPTVTDLVLAFAPGGDCWNASNKKIKVFFNSSINSTIVSAKLVFRNEAGTTIFNTVNETFTLTNTSTDTGWFIRCISELWRDGKFVDIIVTDSNGFESPIFTKTF